MSAARGSSYLLSTADLLTLLFCFFITQTTAVKQEPQSFQRVKHKQAVGTTFAPNSQEVREITILKRWLTRKELPEAQRLVLQEQQRLGKKFLIQGGEKLLQSPLVASLVQTPRMTVRMTSGRRKATITIYG